LEWPWFYHIQQQYTLLLQDYPTMDLFQALPVIMGIEVWSLSITLSELLFWTMKWECIGCCLHVMSPLGPWCFYAAVVVWR
jgi:hypothetical protein